MEEVKGTRLAETRPILIDPKDDVSDRGQWGSRTEFLLACIGMSVGLGNIWRFPYLAYKNGGAAFLIPYFLLLLLVGKPMFFLELAIGQFASASPILVWKCCPIAKGVGWAMQLVSFLVAVYYNVIVAYTIFFMASCFAPVVPWKDCYDWWGADERCYLRKLITEIKTNFGKWKDVLKVGLSNVQSVLPHFSEFVGYMNAGNFGIVANGTRPCLGMNGSEIIHLDLQKGSCHSNVTYETASSQYWKKHVLHIDESNGIDDLGSIRWDLCLCLLLAWTLVFLSLIKGIQSSGKVVYFTATFPYIILLILVVKGLTLDGAMDGLKYLFIPEWSKLLQVEVWRAAAEQMFFSLGISWGVIITFGSYNGFRNRTHIDSVAVSLIDFATSLIGCIVIFSVLGYLAKQLGISIDVVAAKGPGLAFEIYPEALALLPAAPFWSFLFFFMLFTLGLDSEFGSLETTLSSIFDAWPVLRKKKPLVVFLTCSVYFLCGLPCVTSGGQYFLNLMDLYAAGTSVIFIAFIEIVSISWIYGSKRLMKDIKFMLDYKMSQLWYISWTFICPVFLGIILVLSFAFYTHATYEDYVYPAWGEAIGLCMQFSVIAQIPIWAIITLYQHYKKGDIMGAFRPEESWGPADPGIRQEWKESQKLVINANQSIDSTKDGILNLIVSHSTTSLITSTESSTESKIK